MPERLSYDRTVELLRELIAEKGEDFIYRDPADYGADCFYVLNGQQDHGKTWGEALRAGLVAGEPGE